MLKIERFINELMNSNCYIVWDDESHRCIVIDPASEKSLKEIAFINDNKLMLDYIFLTHEHTDHTWGVNALLDKFATCVVCSEKCKENLSEAGNAYFRLNYERKDYSYAVRQVDCTTESLNNSLEWSGHNIKFIPTPGHSLGSICIDIEGMLFTGDTIMQYKAYINKRNGDLSLYKISVQEIVYHYPCKTEIFPGHGECFCLESRYCL